MTTLRLAIGLALLASPAAGQRLESTYRASTAVVPRTITVGDVFQAAVRVELPPHANVAFPDSLDLPADVEHAGRREIRIDSTENGNRLFTAVYPLTAWRPGPIALPGVAVQVQTDGADTDVDAAFPAFDVESVLPADTAGIQPKPAKDVLGANRVWWPILLVGAVLLALLALAVAWYRRRKPQEEVAEVDPGLSPRERALAQLARARESGLVEAGEMKEFYSRVTEAVRVYVAALDPRWSTHLTTTELAGALRRNGIDVEAAALARLLATADLVKFARMRPAASEAHDDWTAAHGWVSAFDWPPPAAVVPEAKAA